MNRSGNQAAVGEPDGNYQISLDNNSWYSSVITGRSRATNAATVSLTAQNGEQAEFRTSFELPYNARFTNARIRYRAAWNPNLTAQSQRHVLWLNGKELSAQCASSLSCDVDIAVGSALRPGINVLQWRVAATSGGRGQQGAPWLQISNTGISLQ